MRRLRQTRHLPLVLGLLSNMLRPAASCCPHLSRHFRLLERCSEVQVPDSSLPAPTSRSTNKIRSKLMKLAKGSNFEQGFVLFCIAILMPVDSRVGDLEAQYWAYRTESKFVTPTPGQSQFKNTTAVELASNVCLSRVQNCMLFIRTTY